VLGALASNRLGHAFFTPAAWSAVEQRCGMKKRAAEPVRRAERGGC